MATKAVDIGVVRKQIYPSFGPAFYKYHSVCLCKSWGFFYYILFIILNQPSFLVVSPFFPTSQKSWLKSKFYPTLLGCFTCPHHRQTINAIRYLACFCIKNMWNVLVHTPSSKRWLYIYIYIYIWLEKVKYNDIFYIVD